MPLDFENELGIIVAVSATCVLYIHVWMDGYV